MNKNGQKTTSNSTQKTRNFNQAEEILKARNIILEGSFHCSLDELLQKTLDEIEKLTESEISFFHFVEPDQRTISLQTWSTNTINNKCKAKKNK